MSGGGGGGGGSNNIPLPPAGATALFPDQSNAQVGALSGAQGIANNTFYPMPQVSSFLFPQGIPGSIAPQGGSPIMQQNPGSGGGGGGSPTPPMDPSIITAQQAQAILAGEGAQSLPQSDYAQESDLLKLSGQDQSKAPWGGDVTQFNSDVVGAMRGASGSFAGFGEGAGAPGNNNGLNNLNALEMGELNTIAQGGNPWDRSAGQGQGGGGGGGWTQVGMSPPPTPVGSQTNPALAGFLSSQMGNSNGFNFGGGTSGIPNVLASLGMGGQQAPMTGGGGNGGMGAPGMAGPGGGSPGLASGAPQQGFGPPTGAVSGTNPLGLSQNFSAPSQGSAGFSTNPLSAVEQSASEIGGAGFQGQNTQDPLGPNFVSPGTQGTGQGAQGAGMAFSYPGAAAFLGLGPQIAASAMNNPSLLQFGGGEMLGNMNNSAVGNLNTAGNAILNTGFDPQKALYERTRNQNAQQAAANMGNAGLGNTPYGTSVENLNNENFNIDWQNAQEGRQAQAISSATGAYQGAQGLQSNDLTSAENAFNAAQSEQMQGLTSLQGGAMGATAQSQQAISDFLGYAGAATQQNQLPIELYQAEASAANAAQSNKQSAQQAGFGQGMGLLGSAASGLGSIAAAGK